MSVRAEIERIINDSIVIRNLEQLSYCLKLLVLEVKDEFRLKLGYEPKISECLYIIYTGKTLPDKCLMAGCDKFGVFRGQLHLNNAGYRYCCKEHSDKDPKRNALIQSKRLPKIDYKAVHEKVVKTKSENIDESGLNVHQRTGIKTKKTREQNYDTWYKSTCDAQSRIPKLVRQQRFEKRQHALELKYGVSHVGGGYSKIKCVEIGDKQFHLQGYEDIAIFKLIESGYSTDDIEIVGQREAHRIHYIIDNENHSYYPDIWIKSENRYIEVKSDYWYNREKYKTDTKLEFARNVGIKIDLIVYGNGDKSEIQRIRKSIKRIK